MSTNILAFAGSTRKDSFNKKLVNIAAEEARKAGATVTVIDLKDYPLPLYDGDLEATEGMPENARKLKQLFASHNALLIAAPEYNGGMTAVLKNALDWVSRPAEKGEAMYASTAGKIGAILSASPSGFGGLRAQPSTRHVLQALQVNLLADQVVVSAAHTAFGDDGQLKDSHTQAAVAKLAQHLATAA